MLRLGENSESPVGASMILGLDGPQTDSSVLTGALALVLFVVKFLGWLMRTEKEEVATAPPGTEDQELWAEIRDLRK